MQEQEQFTQVCYIKTGLENYIYQLIITTDIHKIYTRTIRKQLKRVLVYMITPQDMPIDILIYAFNNLHISKK